MSFLGDIGSFFDLGGDYEGPSPEHFLKQVPGTLQKYFAPYEEMALHPTETMTMLGKGFTASPGYQYQLKQALNAIGEAAAAGGMAGSPMQEEEAASAATGLAGRDYYDYLNHIMNLYTGGVRGYSTLGEDLARALMSRAALTQTKAEEAQRVRGGLFSDILSTLGAGAAGGFGELF